MEVGQENVKSQPVVLRGKRVFGDRTNRANNDAVSEKSTAATSVELSAVVPLGDRRLATPLSRETQWLEALGRLPRPYAAVLTPDPDDGSVGTDAYAKEIFTYYQYRQYVFRITKHFLAAHASIRPRIRLAVINWLLELQEYLEFNHDTLYMAVKLFDFYLSKTKSMQAKKAYPLMAGCLFVAMKFEECMLPSLSDVVQHAPDDLSEEAILLFEQDILTTLSYDVSFPVSYRFLRRLASLQNDGMAVLTLARYYLESSLMSHTFSHYIDSKLAAAAMLLARINFQVNHYPGARLDPESLWSRNSQVATTYSVAQLVDVVQDLSDWVQRPVVSDMTIKQLQVKVKYSDENFRAVATQPMLPDQQLRRLLQKLAGLASPSTFKPPRRDAAVF